MATMTDLQIDREIEEAVKFLVAAIEKSGDNDKPVILYSFRVGLYLRKQGYNQDIVIAGILHDLLEDSATERKEIAQKFGEKVAKLVQANSFDKKIKDKKIRYQQTFSRCLKLGKEALLIKAADILDNSHYYPLAQDEKLFPWLLEKMKHFITHTKKVLGNEAVWGELNEKYKQLHNGPKSDLFFK